MNKDYEIEKIEAYLFGETSATEAVEIEERIASDADFAAQVKMIEALIKGIRQHSFNEAKKRISSIKRNEYSEKILDEVEHKIKFEKLKNLEFQTGIVASEEESELLSYFLTRQQENVSFQNSEKQAEKIQKRRNSTLLLYLITIGIVIAGFTFLLIPTEQPSINGESDKKYIENDSDKDGFDDNVDECPNEKGECKGCLCSSKVNDSDKDNIPDEEDKCPDEYGIKALNGCPDKEKPAKKSDEIAKTDRKVYSENDELNAFKIREDQFLKLPYGTYKGEVRNGKPHGHGTIFFENSHQISLKDLKKRMARVGEYITGEFHEGNLVEGQWFDKNNNLIDVIIIGR
jgi:hypothetical protein